MTIQNNRQQGFDLSSNGAGLILSSPKRGLILPEKGLQVQSQGLESRPAGGDEQALIIQEAKNQGSNAYSLVNGIFVPQGTETVRAIELVKAGDFNIHYGQNTSLSFNEILHNSLEKIIKSEAGNPLRKDIEEYFVRLEDLSNLLVTNKNLKEAKRNYRSSHFPFVMNRETFKKEGIEHYYPLKPFQLGEESSKQLENIVLKSLKIEDDSKSSPAKRFALRFLTNTVFIENFKSEKITGAVIEALKTDQEPAAKKIYEHYLTTQLGNLAPSQKEEIIDALNKNSRLSSHLAQSLFLSEPSLKERINIKEFPTVKNFEDLETILDNFHAHSKLAMNQVDLLPSQINPDANYGIEIEMKLAGRKGERDDNSPIQQLLKPYASFIELGIDYGGVISEMRTGNGGFKLNEENQRNLFEILNIFHKSPDLMLFLSQHVHVDKESNTYPSDSLLSLIQNDNDITLETQSLDLDTMQLNPNNNLVYSYQVPNLVDQMIVLEALKKTKPSAEAIIKSFELNDKYGISLGMAQVMLTAVESEKGYLIPNLLRLNSEGKNYLETNYFAKHPEDLIFKMIDINREDVVRLIIDKVPVGKLGQVLTLTNRFGHNLLMIAVDKGSEKLVNLILDKIPVDNLEEVLTQTDFQKRNALMIAVEKGNKELAELVLSLVPEFKLAEMLTQLSDSKCNALMIAVDKNDQELVKLILDKIPKENLPEVLMQTNKKGCNALKLAKDRGNDQITAILTEKYEALGLTPTP